MNRTILNAVAFLGVLIIPMGMTQAKEEQKKAVTVVADSATEKAMAAMQQFSSPNENHKKLEPFVGAWNYTGQWWVSPDTQPQIITGTAIISFIFGGRFLKQEFHGNAKDLAPFEGLGFTGYDNIRKEYSSVWLDNVSTGIMTSGGQFDGVTKALTEESDFSCPVTGEAHRKARAVWTTTDADHNTYETYMSTPEGKEYKAMEIHYTRQSVPCPPSTERC